MPSAVIQLEDVHKRYRIYRRRYQSMKEIFVHRRLGEWEDHWALRGVSFEVLAGTTLGLIGPNGAGKSTTLKLMARILAPDRGKVRISRKVAGLLELGSGFQMDYTGLENTELNASLLGLSRNDIRRKLPSIIEFSELGDAMRDPLRTYSTGMVMRLAFSIAIHVDPDVLLVDEILAVGDEAFQKKCLDHIARFQAQGGTIVLVSHSAGQVQDLCTHAAWIEGGIVQAAGDPATVVNAYVDRVRGRETTSQVEVPVEQPAVELGAVRLLDRAGRAVSALRRGDPLLVEVPYHVNEAVEDPVFGISLVRNDGAYVYGTNTSVDGLRLRPLRTDGVVTLRYEGLPLLGGTYRFVISVSSRSRTLPIDSKDRVYSFRVPTESDEEGLVRLDHEWLLAEEVAPVEPVTSFGG